MTRRGWAAPYAAGGSPIDSLGGGGTFLASTLPNLAMSVPLAELRLRQQRKERADAAALASKGLLRCHILDDSGAMDPCVCRTAEGCFWKTSFDSQLSMLDTEI